MKSTMKTNWKKTGSDILSKNVRRWLRESISAERMRFLGSWAAVRSSPALGQQTRLTSSDITLPLTVKNAVETTLEEIADARSLITENSTNEVLQKTNLCLNRPVSSEEVLEAKKEVEDSTPRKNQVKIRQIKAAASEIQNNTSELVE